jgi:hypothetical protein
MAGPNREELLPVPYSHVIFTLPGALAALVRQNAKLLYNLLFRCVSETLLTVARDPSRLGVDLGFLAVCSTPGIRNCCFIRTSIAWFPPVVSLRTGHAGFTAANDSSFPVLSSDGCFGASFSLPSARPFAARNCD